MNLENLSEKSRSYLGSARLLAIGLSHQWIMPEHILKVMLEDRESVAFKSVNSSKGDVNKILEQIEKFLDAQSKVESTSHIEPNFDKRVASMLVSTSKILRKQVNADDTITPKILFISLLELGDSSIEKLLKSGGVSSGELLKSIQDKSLQTDDSNKSALERYGNDLTREAREGKLDPVVGRDEEIRRVAQVLSRRLKNNPVMIGEPGVGKTAIVEGLAQRIANGDVPSSLKDKRLIVLDVSLMLAGAKFRGEFEERLKETLKEVIELEGEVICFIDELHSLIGAGASDGAMDAANILKPALARGELHCIGATTLDEYRKHIEKDAALARRFQPVKIKEPSEEEAVTMLRGLREKYELHHGVTITDGALIAAVKLSRRYIADRFLPDKAIDLIDEAASRLRMILDSKPEELDSLERKIIRFKIELEARSRDEEVSSSENGEDNSEKDSLDEIRHKIKSLEKKAVELNEKWNLAKKEVLNAQEVKAQLERARHDLNIAQNEGRFEEAGRLAYDVIPSLERQVSSDKNRLSIMVRKEDIASVVARWTGIPVEKMLEGDKQRLLRMEEVLSSRVIGQSEAVVAVSEAVRRTRAGLGDDNKPSGSFLFLGPTGVGKTELCKTLASFLFASDKSMTRIDMSEYMEKHSVSRLIGAPPGYVGYEEGGYLTKSLRQQPYQVVLFDEIEKAHGDVFNIFLQLLDEGRLTDGQGKSVDARHAIFIMTSNLGAEFLIGDSSERINDSVKEKIMERVRQTFRPEFINRLDDILIFSRLGVESMGRIVDLRIEDLKNRLLDRGYYLKISPEARSWLQTNGMDSDYGARPLNRLIRRKVETPLSEMILQEDLSEDILIDVREDQLVVNALKNQ